MQVFIVSGTSLSFRGCCKSVPKARKHRPHDEVFSGWFLQRPHHQQNHENSVESTAQTFPPTAAHQIDIKRPQPHNTIPAHVPPASPVNTRSCLGSPRDPTPDGAAPPPGPGGVETEGGLSLPLPARPSSPPPLSLPPSPSPPPVPPRPCWVRSVLISSSDINVSRSTKDWCTRVRLAL